MCMLSVKIIMFLFVNCLNIMYRLSFHVPLYSMYKILFHTSISYVLTLDTQLSIVDIPY